MRARSLVVVGFFLLSGAAACGDNKPAGISDEVVPVGGVGGSGGTPDPYCRDYCVALVANAADCAHYNDNRRCEEICGFYRAGGCSDLYTALADCNKTDPQLSCFLASGGKWGVNIFACNSEYLAFNNCIEEKDAGVCPY